MASVIGRQDHLHLELTAGEKWAALRRSDLLIPWPDIAGVEQVAEPFRLVHGLRAPGLALPWRTKIGTWRSGGRKIFAVTHSGAAGIHLALHRNEFDDIYISLPDPGVIAEQIRAGMVAASDAG